MSAFKLRPSSRWEQRQTKIADEGSKLRAPAFRGVRELSRYVVVLAVVDKNGDSSKEYTVHAEKYYNNKDFLTLFDCLKKLYHSFFQLSIDVSVYWNKNNKYNKMWLVWRYYKYLFSP